MFADASTPFILAIAFGLILLALGVAFIKRGWKSRDPSTLPEDVDPRTNKIQAHSRHHDTQPS